MSAEPPMAPAPEGGTGLADLLQRAEAILARRAREHAVPEGDETMRLVHQLAVHQVELDLQEQELRQARDQLAESLARYVDLYDFAPAGFVTIDEDGVIVQINLAAGELLGLERALAVGAVLVEFVAPADHGVYLDFVERVGRIVGEHSCEVRLRRADDAEVTVAMEARRHGVTTHTRLAMIDVTELRVAQAAAARLSSIAEREEIARMLHDTVQQRLFGLSTSLQALQLTPGLTTSVNARLGTLIDDLEVTIMNIRQTIFDQRRGWSLEEPTGPDPASGV